MKKLLAAMFVALLMVGCGGDSKKPGGDSPESNQSSVAPTDAKPAQVGKIDLDDKETLDKIIAEAKPVQKEVQKQAVVDRWAEWEANPEPYGGPKVLAKIKEAKESNDTYLNLDNIRRLYNQITDLTPLAELTNLESLHLSHNQISDLTPLKGLTKLKSLSLDGNQISDLSSLKGLTNLDKLSLDDNQITDVSPLSGLTKLETLSLTKNEISDLSPLKGLTNLDFAVAQQKPNLRRLATGGVDEVEEPDAR